MRNVRLGLVGYFEDRTVDQQLAASDLMKATILDRLMHHCHRLCHVDWVMTQTDGGCVFAQTVDGFWVSSVKRCHESKR